MAKATVSATAPREEGRITRGGRLGGKMKSAEGEEIKANSKKNLMARGKILCLRIAVEHLSSRMFPSHLGREKKKEEPEKKFSGEKAFRTSFRKGIR